jgi:hypothetical protein
MNWEQTDGYRYDYNPIAAPQALVLGQLPSNQTGVREAIGRRRTTVLDERFNPAMTH